MSYEANLNLRRLSQKLFDLTNNFLTNLPTDVASRDPQNKPYPFRVEHPQQGRIWLTQQEADELDVLVQKIAVLLGDNWDSKSVREHTEVAALQALNANKKSSVRDFRKRKAAALKHWQETLLSPPQNWDVYYGVHNVSSQGLPFTIGRVTFLELQIGNEAILLHQRDLLRRTQETSQVQNQLIEFHTEDLTRDPNIKRAKITVQANTAVVAVEKALHKLRRTLATMNFFAELVHGPPTLVYLPGEATRDKQSISAFRCESDGTTRSGSFTARIEGSWNELGFFGFYLSRAKKYGFDTVCKLLSEPVLSDLQRRVLTALRWAGRASALNAIKANYYKHNTEREQSFLFCAICLESLFCKRHETGDVTERLASRCAQFLAVDKEQHRAIYKDVKALYNRRSDVVHEGSLDISQDDLDQISVYVRESLIKMLTDPVLVSLPDEAAFEAWFKQDQN